MYIDMPSYVEEILEELLKKNIDAFLVGGSLRDILIGKIPQDWDIASSAEPIEIAEIFKDKKVVETGIRYGTVTVVCIEGNVEITTFRSEGKYSNGRHPDWVEFEKDIERDLSRRDFTINAMAFNKEQGLIDPYGGIGDIKNKIIRAVGNPIARFTEDGLRMLRAVRFATVLDFAIESRTLEAIKSLVEKINLISFERIKEEVYKILISPHASRGIKLLVETGLLKHILPEVFSSLFIEGNCLDYSLYLMDNTPPSIELRLASLFCNQSDNDIEKVDRALTRLKFSNDLIKRIKILVDNFLAYRYIKDRLEVKRLIKKVGKENIQSLLTLQNLDADYTGNKELRKRFILLEGTLQEVLRNKEPIYLEDLFLSGEDIIEMGFDEGIIIGEILEYLMEEVLLYPEKNREDLLKEIIEERWK